VRAAFFALFLGACLAEPGLPPPVDPAPLPTDFAAIVKPMLTRSCFPCHGPDGATRQVNLRFDTRAGLFEARAAGTVVVPGKPAESLLYQRLTAPEPIRRMPPVSNLPVTPREIDAVAAWIEAGAVWPEPWAFTAPVRPPVPAVQDGAWVKNPIDSFVLARLESEGLHPAPPAPPATLLRRVSFDLTGLPASPEALRTADYETFVEGALASVAHAEEQTRRWLDAARYADSHGFSYDEPRAMWPWRDWVIAAFQANMLFDAFVREQIAGDRLPEPTDDQILASAFNRNHSITIEGGVVEEELRAVYRADRVATTASALLGVTLECAKCHDHKYDPFTQRDFYRLAACFDRLEERGDGDENHFAPTRALASPIDRAAIPAVDAAIAALSSRPDDAAAMMSWETSARALPPVAWTTVPSVATSREGAAFMTRGDGVVVATSEVTERDVYSVALDLAAPTNALRIVVVPDDSLPQSGPGRSSSGNFAVNEAEIFAPLRVPVVAAWTNRYQSGFPAAAVMDLNTGGGWAIDGAGHDWWLVLSPSVPIGPGRVVLKLHQTYGDSHLIGAFRVEVSSDPLASMTPELATILATSVISRSPASQEALRRYYRLHQAPERAQNLSREALLAQRRLLERRPDVMVMAETDTSRATYLLLRGQYDRLGPQLRCGTPVALSKNPDAELDRLGLADWLVGPDQPLVPRVIVNRLWAHHFGAGLVTTLDNFGVTGAEPSHLALLDWLATELVSSRYDLRHIERLIVTSATYRQSSSGGPDDNRLLSRGPRHRLTAEAIRDQALSVSGLLDPTVGGPSVFPYHPIGLWLEQNDQANHSSEYVQDVGAGLYRRSMYTYWKRTLPPPFLNLFGAPSREISVVDRERSSTAIQALAMLDDPQIIEAERFFAEKILDFAAGDPDEAIAEGFFRLTARVPSAEEKAILRALYDASLVDIDPASRERLLSIGDNPRAVRADEAALAAMTEVARALFNTGEVGSKE